MAESKDIRKIIGDKLWKLRDKLNYSLQRMADNCAIDYAHYYQIEQGKRYVRLDVLQRISNNLGVPMDFWFRDAELDSKIPDDVYARIILNHINTLGSGKKEFLLDLLSAYKKVHR
ncbi:MAG: helix-turn-helix domain-containing protein [Candidatus Margulisbacteria bacterium]|jgi:transcriptional regulator with XRE-family HTH domain|nr:helix-turn-helix domain-containing protein [Candidatus Margulisiibacteriota bacterium]